VDGDERRQQNEAVRIDRRRSAEDVADRIFSGYRPAARQAVSPVEEPPTPKPAVEEPEPPEPKPPVQDPEPPQT